MERESTPSVRLQKSVLEETPDANRGRKTLVETEREAEYPQRNGLQVVKLTWPIRLFGCHI